MDLQRASAHDAKCRGFFQSRMEKLGLGSEHFIIIYDGMGYFGARPWWMLKSFGHERCACLTVGFQNGKKIDQYRTRRLRLSALCLNQNQTPRCFGKEGIFSKTLREKGC